MLQGETEGIMLTVSQKTEVTGSMGAVAYCIWGMCQALYTGEMPQAAAWHDEAIKGYAVALAAVAPNYRGVL